MYAYYMRYTASQNPVYVPNSNQYTARVFFTNATAAIEAADMYETSARWFLASVVCNTSYEVISAFSFDAAGCNREGRCRLS